ncbi:malonate--CoA ligase isoform X1 [Canna indica]|uniref:4-coumarate--CoA ligase n=1 Tax=Canna indica TaxID=4628 RepID=A0AAQ3Q7H2_9LILI|nr:malonate--CoA ligase isoform X1 [Canna indica]
MSARVVETITPAAALVSCVMSSFKASNRLPSLISHCLLSLSLRSITFSPSLSQQFRLVSSHSTGPSSGTFMEVVKAALGQVSATQERAALRAEQKSYSYLQIVASALNISNILHNEVAITAPAGCTRTTNEVVNVSRYLHGARVGIVAKPSAEFVSAVLGTWLSGGVAVPLALSYPETELLHVMNDSDVSMILSTQEHHETMKNVAAKCSAKVSVIPTVTSMPPNNNCNEHSGREAVNLVAELIREIEDSCLLKGDDPALILYTSGTTGKPKGVVHTHKSIIAQVQILTEAWEYTSNDQLLNCLPLHHVHGLFNALFAPLYAGAAVEFMPKFSVRGVWQRWRDSYPKDGNKADDAITLFTGVPTMYTRLLQGFQTMDADLQKASASAANQLRLMMCGSSALPYPVMKQWEDITGHRLLERYGMTEFVMALSNPLHGLRKGGTVGKPLPRVEVKILAEDGSEVVRMGVGELCVRSPSLFKEYWKQPKVTKESFIDGGFFKTGDTVTMDEDGYYIILGRTNADIMKVGGYKLSALEIEAVLLEHEAVLECCVLGLSDEDYGEIVCAIVVPNADAKRSAEQELKPVITLADLCDWSKERLAPYKIPTKLFLWDSLPRNAMGKVNKKEIRKLLEQRP